MDKSFVLAEVKEVESKAPAGEFEAILSSEALDRDGEILDAGCFEPLPASIPVHAFHDFHDPIGRGEPFYEGDILKVRGIYASTPRAQEIRTLVTEGVMGNMSVGFMSAIRKEVDGVAHVTSGELVEGSFVSVPSNREAAVLMAKEWEGKVGARNSASDAARIQGAHDVLVELGATCEAKHLTLTVNDRGGNPQETARQTIIALSKTPTPPDPEAAAAPAPAVPSADVAVARARAVLASAQTL